MFKMLPKFVPPELTKAIDPKVGTTFMLADHQIHYRGMAEQHWFLNTAIL